MSLFSPTADVSVRPAVPGDEVAMADLQIAAWRATHAGALGADVLDRLDPDGFRTQWAAAVGTPPGPGFAVLVACAGPRVVGYVALSPGAIAGLEVAPDERRKGHGSRLLSAAVDRLRQDGAEEVSAWVLAGDEGREHFLSGAGMAADGRRRTLDVGGREVVESRWSATL
ncbi:GNAT family N-acetyltransferase [Flavimobilis sp. GY10621]|uniref:GNAT family N-acetyltransferase n=1 Tax=Flavimobilis rhizosphaerae TaxID=2775421 RepID=A0ABR9DRA4_9MICO|nr:GNAT family N-acetyltransferase [Flavimobilis rhizosphaerae]MBD9699651.1 GNAT family N-acetyltransferase [Flavimobilis rhizosphaerae]